MAQFGAFHSTASFPPVLPLPTSPFSLRQSRSAPPPPPSSNPWKFGTNELTAELPPRSLVPNYTVLHTRFILQMARLRSPAGRGHLFHWSVKVDGCCFRILCDQLRAPSNHPAPYVENKSPCYWAHSSCDGCLYVCVCVCVPLLLLLRCSVTGIGTSVIWCTHLRVVVADAWNHDGYPCSFFFFTFSPCCSYCLYTPTPFSLFSRASAKHLAKQQVRWFCPVWWRCVCFSKLWSKTDFDA